MFRCVPQAAVESNSFFVDYYNSRSILQTSDCIKNKSFCLYFCDYAADVTNSITRAIPYFDGIISGSHYSDGNDIIVYCAFVAADHSQAI